MKKIVLKLELYDDKAKHKALKTVSTLPGIDSIAMEMTENKMTVIGTVDPISVVTKLRKNWPASTITLVEPIQESKNEEGGENKDQTKEEEKMPETGEGPKKDEDKENEPIKEESNNNDKTINNIAEKEYQSLDAYMIELQKANYRAYNPNYMNTYYHVQSIEENPNACAIC